MIYSVLGRSQYADIVSSCSMTVFRGTASRQAGSQSRLDDRLTSIRAGIASSMPLLFHPSSLFPSCPLPLTSLPSRLCPSVAFLPFVCFRTPFPRVSYEVRESAVSFL